MSDDTMNRKRQVNVDDEQLDRIISQISDKIVSMVDETCAKANKMLDIYNMETRMQIVIKKKGEFDEADKANK